MSFIVILFYFIIIILGLCKVDAENNKIKLKWICKGSSLAYPFVLLKRTYTQLTYQCSITLITQHNTQRHLQQNKLDRRTLILLIDFLAVKFRDSNIKTGPTHTAAPHCHTASMLLTHSLNAALLYIFNAALSHLHRPDSFLKLSLYSEKMQVIW